MSLSDIGRLVLRRWLIAVVTALACVGVTAAYAFSLPTTYTATTRLYVSMATGTSVNDSYQGGLAAQQRVTSYSHVAGGATVAERVVDDLDPPTTPGELQSKISVTFPPASALLDISVTDSTPEGARILADKVAAHFRDLVGEIETTTVGAAPAAEATVIDPALLPAGPDGPDVPRLLAIGLFGGIALGGVAAFVRDRLDRRVRRPEQLTGVVPVPVLATVPGDASEARKVFTRLRARLTSGLETPGPASVLLMSVSHDSVPGVATGLTEALAATGRRVVLLDADVSGGGVSARLKMVPEPGLAEWLSAASPQLDELLRWGPAGYAVLPLGAVDERTSDLLDSPRMADLLAQLQARFDHVVVDTAPIASDAAGLTLAPRCAAVLAVAELKSATLSGALAATTSLREVGAPLIGTILSARQPGRKQWRRERSAAAARPSLVPSA